MEPKHKKELIIGALIAGAGALLYYLAQQSGATAGAGSASASAQAGASANAAANQELLMEEYALSGGGNAPMAAANDVGPVQAPNFAADAEAAIQTLQQAGLLSGGISPAMVSQPTSQSAPQVQTPAATPSGGVITKITPQPRKNPYGVAVPY